MRIKDVFAAITALAIIASLTVVMQAAASPSNSVGGSDDKVSGQQYVRYDGGIDDTIEACNNREDPEVFGGRTQNNEPFSVVDPLNPDLVLAGWNDYCSDWMGLGFSLDGGQN